MEVKILKLHPQAKVPTYAHEGDAGLDLYSVEEVEILPGEIKRIKTGLSFELPNGYVGLVWDKSGISQLHGLKILGGVLDAGYRGEVIIGMVNLSNKSYAIQSGDKITQLLIQKVERPTIIEVENLSETNRGTGGFGSTGK